MPHWQSPAHLLVRWTCIDVIDEILEEDFNALLDEGSEILHSIEGTILEEKLFAEFDEFMAKTVNENSESEYLELKPLPHNLEYVFLEEPSFLLVIISSQLSEENKNNSFDHCLNNIDKILQRCKDAHLVLNWEKCHFMVKEGIVLGHKTIVHTDHSALRHLFKKRDAKPRLIRWTLLLQEFDIEIKDKKGTKNVTSNHLSRIENDETSDDSEVDDNFPGETLMEINTEDEPWFADFSNYLVSDIIPKGMTYQQKNKFFSDLKHYFWEEPYLFKDDCSFVHHPGGRNVYIRIEIVSHGECTYFVFSSFYLLNEDNLFGHIQFVMKTWISSCFCDSFTLVSINELIGNLKVHEMIIKKEFEIFKANGERRSLALKTKKESSDEECSTSRSENEEYEMVVRDFKKFF
nr:reverse transcriptase domain-containing protein [Tanacetum cinerariifolium]